MSVAVKVIDLTKRYGDLVAVNKLNFSVDTGEVFGLLGPNGAGKTTTVEMIEGLRKPDNGSIEVYGLDARQERSKIKELMGVQLQSTTLYEKIRVKEAIDLFGGYYKKSLPTDNILDQVSLTDTKNSFVGTLSGGQRQRLALALALVNDPELLFLDEPTTGLDPQARRNVWDIIRSLSAKGKTIILTTHYMEEAEHLCHRVGIIDHGSFIALDTPRNLIANADLESAIELVCRNDDAESLIMNIAGVNRVTKEEDDIFILHTRESSSVLNELTRLSDEKKLNTDNISVRQGNLEDVFLLLTGRKLRD